MSEWIVLNRRARYKRALRWPVILWNFRKAGASWGTAWRLTHWVIWYQFTPTAPEGAGVKP